nr:HAD hydrolase-like protein [Acidithiobacillus ferriphilus]
MGDSMRDMLAARAAGARPMLVLTGKGQSMRLTAEAAGVSIFADLNAAVHAILGIP